MPSRIWSLINDDDDDAAENDSQKMNAYSWLLFLLHKHLQFSRSVQYANGSEAVLRLNIQGKRSIRNRNTKWRDRHFAVQSAKQQSEMIKFAFSEERKPRRLIFKIVISNLQLCPIFSFVVVLTVINKVNDYTVFFGKIYIHFSMNFVLGAAEYTPFLTI